MVSMAEELSFMPFGFPVVFGTSRFLLRLFPGLHDSTMAEGVEQTR